MTNPAKFIREVRQEVGKVAWPTRKETWVSTLTVLLMVLFAALFFMVVDSIIASLIETILG
jgi:preprotein translocase subunit SecE